DGPLERWTLEAWADDVVALCDALGIERPVVLGKSFGAFVAATYAGRHPDHPGRLVLLSPAARHLPERCIPVFERLGGPEVGAAARAAFAGNPSDEDVRRYEAICLPLSTAASCASTSPRARRARWTCGRRSPACAARCSSSPAWTTRSRPSMTH